MRPEEISAIESGIRVKIEKFNTSKAFSKEYLANICLDTDLRYESQTLLVNLTAFVYRQEIDQVYHEYPASLWDTVKYYLPSALKKLFKPPIMKKLKIEYAILYPQLQKRKRDEIFVPFAFKTSDIGHGEN